MGNRDDAAVLYICTEDGESEFCKVGMSDRPTTLFDRLRTLNQGNPRELRFDNLWLAPANAISRIEAMIKNRKQAIGGTGRTEWYREDHRNMAAYIQSVIQGDESIISWVDDNCVPYRAKTLRECPINRHYFTGKPLVPQVIERLGLD